MFIILALGDMSSFLIFKEFKCLKYSSMFSAFTKYC